MDGTLTQRQRREIQYHCEHAVRRSDRYQAPSYDLLENPGRRWWNASWAMYGEVMNQMPWTGKKVLVPGCGFGEDAIRLARLGARVTAFDLSPDMLAVARTTAERERVVVGFHQMPAERLNYADNEFDAVVVRDILHHAEPDSAMQEIVRVARPGASFLMNEVYCHSRADRIRRSWLAEKILYPRMVRFIYHGQEPYITQDERKLNERDIDRIVRYLEGVKTKYFYFLPTRVVPVSWIWACKLDRGLLKILSPLSSLLAGRIVLTGRIRK